MLSIVSRRVQIPDLSPDSAVLNMDGIVPACLVWTPHRIPSESLHYVYFLLTLRDNRQTLQMAPKDQLTHVASLERHSMHRMTVPSRPALLS